MYVSDNSQGNLGCCSTDILQRAWCAQIYEIDHHFIKEKLESGLICTLHVSVENQVEDNITTGLPNC